MARTKHGLPGIYNSTPITLNDQEGAAPALDSSGRLILGSGGAFPASAALGDAGAANPTTTTVGSIPLVMNATTVDRQRAVVNALNSVGTGIAAAGLVAQLDDTSPTVITENSFGTLRLDSGRALRVNLEGVKATYSASVTGLAPAASATDIFTIAGSATTTIRITRIQISGVATAAGAYAVQLIKRSVADTAGTSSAPTIVPHDSNSAAATAVVAAYTANPTTGTAVGTLQVKTITVSTAAGAIPIVPTIFDFELRGEQAIVLRGTAQQLCLNLNAVTMTGGVLSVDISFTEEA